jgi:hypothetical protein
MTHSGVTLGEVPAEPHYRMTPVPATRFDREARLSSNAVSPLTGCSVCVAVGCLIDAPSPR